MKEYVIEVDIMTMRVLRVISEVEVAEPSTETPAPAKPAPDEKETPEEVQRRARKPPKDGPCKRCGQAKPINRLMLCYPCWVKTELEKKGWREGQSHPAECRCDLDCVIERPQN